MKFRMPGATAIAAILVAVAAPAPLAIAQNGGQPTIQVSRDVVQPLNEARAALTAKDWATAKTKLDAATAKSKTPVDKGQIDRLRFYLASQTKDGPMQLASINALLSSGTLTPEETKQYKSGLASAHADAGDLTASRNAAKAYIDEYGGTPDQLMSLGNEFYKAKDYATTIVYAKKAIDASNAAGKVPSESWYRVLASAQNAEKQMHAYYATREATLTAYPTSPNAEQYWMELIAGRTQNAPKFGRATHLDLYRTLMAAGVKLTAQQKGQAISEALTSRGLPNEALQLLEPAVASGELSSQEDKDNLAKAKSRIAQDKAGLAKETADALAKADGSTIAKIGEAHLSYGDYPKAIEVLQAALAKGIADPAEAAFARLHLGIAQYRAGQGDAARATWAEVKSDNGATELAQNWTLISKLKS